MRILLQRVSQVSVHSSSKELGAIQAGLLVFVAFRQGDGAAQLSWSIDKIANLRIFSDDEGKMNHSVMDVGGSVLVVSQFTLYGDAQKGRRPSFVDAAPPEIAIPLYNQFVEQLRSIGLRVATGEFGTDMQVELVNDGPVTIWLEKD